MGFEMHSNCSSQPIGKLCSVKIMARKFQFSLGRMVLLVTVLAISFGILSAWTQEMTDEEMNLASIKYDGGLWYGRLNVGWLGQKVETHVDTDSYTESEGPTEKQTACIRHVCQLPRETLEGIKKYLFEKYQSEIYGSVSMGAGYDFHDLTPKVSTPDQVWDLLLHTSLSFPSEKRIKDDAYFALNFECPWDEEHGGSILLDKNGTPQEMGGSSQFF